LFFLSAREISLKKNENNQSHFSKKPHPPQIPSDIFLLQLKFNHNTFLKNQIIKEN